MKDFNINFFYLNFLIKLLIIFLALGLKVFFSHTLSVENFGILYSLIGFFSLMTIFVNLGTQSSQQFFIPRLVAEKQDEKVSFLFQVNYLFQLLMLLLFSLAIFFLIPFLSNNYFHAEIEMYLSIFLLYFIVLNLLNPFRHILISLKRSKLFQSIKLSELLFTLLLAFLFYIIIGDQLLFYFSLSWFLAAIIVLVIFFFILFNKFSFLFKKSSRDWRLFGDHFKYSIYLFSTGIGMTILNHIDLQVITFFLDFSSVAFYSNSFSLINSTVSIFTMLSVIIIPFISDLHYRKNFKKINSILNIFYKIVLFFILPFTLVLFLYSEKILEIIFGKGYGGAKYILSIFSVFLILKIIYAYNISFLNGIGEAKNLFKIVIPIAFINLFLNVVLVTFWGVYGVVFSTIFCWFLLAVLTYFLLNKKILFKIDFKTLFKTILCGIFFILLVLSIKELFTSQNYYISSMIILIISYILYLFLGYLLKVYTIEDLYLFVPSKKYKDKLKKFHKNYLYFLK